MSGLLALALFAGSARGASAAVIFSDNFNSENGGVGATNFFGFTKWTVSDGTVDLIGNGFFDFLPGNGLYVDLDGSHLDAGKLTEGPLPAISLGAGDYTLSFDLAGSQRGGTENVVAKVFGNNSSNYGTLTITGLASATPFQSRTINFTLAAPDTAVRFSFENAGGDNVGALLDNVVLQDVPRLHPVPEPFTLTLLGTGVVGLAIRRRRAVA